MKNAKKIDCDHSSENGHLNSEEFEKLKPLGAKLAAAIEKVFKDSGETRNSFRLTALAQAVALTETECMTRSHAKGHFTYAEEEFMLRAHLEEVFDNVRDMISQLVADHYNVDGDHLEGDHLEGDQLAMMKEMLHRSIPPGHNIIFEHGFSNLGNSKKRN